MTAEATRIAPDGRDLLRCYRCGWEDYSAGYVAGKTKALFEVEARAAHHSGDCGCAFACSNKVALRESSDTSGSFSGNACGGPLSSEIIPQAQAHALGSWARPTRTLIPTWGPLHHRALSLLASDGLMHSKPSLVLQTTEAGTL